MTFGKKISKKRQQERFTQDFLAKSVGVGRVTITKIENNTQLPSVFLAKKILAALHMWEEYSQINHIFFK